MKQDFVAQTQDHVALTILILDILCLATSFLALKYPQVARSLVFTLSLSHIARSLLPKDTGS